MSGWGDDAPIIQKSKGAASAAPAAKSWGDDAPTISKAPGGKKKTSETLGFMENFARPFEQFGKVNPLNALDTHAARDVREAARGQMNDYFDEREETERPGLVGQVAGTILGTAPVLALTRNPLAVGAAQGALSSEHDDATGIALDAAGGAALNWAGGKAVDAAADALKPALSPAVALLQKAGVRLTPGQIKGGKALTAEDKAMSRPIVGDRIAADRTQFLDDFNRGAVNKALFPLGVRLPDDIATGHDAVAFMQGEAGKAYDKILPNMVLEPDARIASGLRNGWQVVKDLSPEMQGRFKSIVGSKLQWAQQGHGASGSTLPVVSGSNFGTLSGRPLAVAIRDIRKLASGYAKSGDQDQRFLGEALGHLDDALQSSLSAQNPGYAKALKAANQAYKGNLVVNRAAAGADEGIASTAQFKTASRAVDRTKGQRASAAGRAPMQDYAKAGRALTGKTPDSGSAGRLLDGNWFAKARGAVDAGLYEADKALTGLRVAPRPSQVEKVAGFLRDNRAALSVAGGPVIGGLLSGLVGND